MPWANIERIEVLDRHTVVITWPDVPPLREVGPHTLAYRPETRAFELAAEAEKVGGVDVRRSPTFFEQQARRSGAGPRS